MVDPINIEAASATLHEIESDACRIAAMARLAFSSQADADELDGFCTAIEVLAKRLGWFAANANELLGKRSLVVGVDARDWLMPDRCKTQKVEG